MFRKSLAVASLLGSSALGIAALAGPATAAPTAPADITAPALTAVKENRFTMERSGAAVKAGCLTKARARVSIQPRGPVEVMYVHLLDLPKKTDFDLFVLQVPDAPFGLGWYQGDLETNKKGEALGKFVGRFNVETFSVAPGTAPAPVVHESPFKDASSNPTTAPLHQYHLGVWFNSPADAAKAGCGNAVTPFNGEHNAGVQALSTRNFPADQGPLRRLNP